MSRAETQRMGRLMAAGWPVLNMIARTPWLLVLILPILSAITYDGGYRRDKFIPVVARGNIGVSVSNMDIGINLRPTANGKGSILTISIVVTKQRYSWGLGIA